MLAALQARQQPATRDPLDDLAATAAVARRRMAAFRPAAPLPVEPVVRDQRRGA
jgi:hypothetical protein